MLQIIEALQTWHVHADVFEHPPPRIASWHPIWSDIAPVDTTTQWREDWSSTSVVNHSIVTDPTIRQPGFDLPCHTWSLLNRFQTGQGPCRANLHKCGLVQSPSCDCGQRQTMNHIVDTCPQTKFKGGLTLLHKADDDTVMWPESTATTALAKWMNGKIIWSNIYIIWRILTIISNVWSFIKPLPASLMCEMNIEFLTGYRDSKCQASMWHSFR